MTSTTAAGPLVLAAALVVALTGCGSGSAESPAAGPSPTGLSAASATAVPDLADAVTNGVDEVDAATALDEALAVLEQSAGYRVSGSPSAGAPLDLTFSAGETAASGEAGAVGRGARGTLTQDGSTFEVLAVDGAVYVRGNLDWLADEVAESARRTLGDKWLLLPDESAQSLATITDPDAFADAVLTPTGTVQSVGVSEIEDVPAVGIRYLDTDATAWLSGVGEPYPLLVERLGATATDGVLRFSDVDEPVTLTAPDADQVVVVEG